MRDDDDAMQNSICEPASQQYGISLIPFEKHRGVCLGDPE